MTAEQTARPFRVHERRVVRFDAAISHPTEGWEGEARVNDIGLGGAGLEMAGNGVRKGDRIVLSCMAPSLWDPLVVAARVAWVRPATRVEPSRFGIAFEPTDAPSVLALFELVTAFAFET